MTDHCPTASVCLLTSLEMVNRAVFLCAAGEREREREGEEETQWSVRLGQTCWTALDVVKPGLRTSINGGVAGGGFGWGARQDGPLLQGAPHHSQAGKCLATSNITDSEIEKFNKEFVSEQPVYRTGLCAQYTFKLLALLAGPSHLLHTLHTLKQGDEQEEENDEEEKEQEEEKEKEEEEEDPTFVPFRHNGNESDMSEDDSDDEEEDSESSEDSSDDEEEEEEDETLKSVKNVAEFPGEKSVESCPVLEEGNNAGSDAMIQSEEEEKAETERDEMTKNDSPGCKRKIGHQEVQEENLSKRQKNIDGVEEESGESVYYDLNNSLETGYTSDVYSDLEDSNEIYSNSFIASY